MIMAKHKTWALAFLAVFASFLALNFVIWRCFTAEMLNAGEYYTPDLVRLGYIVGSTMRRKPESTLPRRHLHSAQYAGQPVDVVTVGDSFSNMKDIGRDTMYQDWLATVHGLTVMNVPPIDGPADEVGTLIVLLNSGYLDRVRPRAVILECVERHCIDSLSGNLDFTLRKNLPDVEQALKRPEWNLTPPTVGFVNTSNFKFLSNLVLYHFSPNAFSSQVYVKELSTPLFSVPQDKRLLFFFEDLTSIRLANARSVGALNDNLNTLALKLKKKNISLYFMPAPNKYTIYSDYIIDNPYPKSVFFELLRGLPKRYVFVDTKTMLAEEVKKGGKDVYFADETHWSWKAAKKIAENMKF
jgi:hypothetical protein